MFSGDSEVVPQGQRQKKQHNEGEKSLQRANYCDPVRNQGDKLLLGEVVEAFAASVEAGVTLLEFVFIAVNEIDRGVRKGDAERNRSHPPRVIPEAALYSGCPGSMSPKQGLAFPLLDPGSRFARPG